MRKILNLFVFIFVFILVSSIFIPAQGVNNKDVEEFLKKVAERKGVGADKIRGINSVNFTNLPTELSLGNIDETNLGLYEVDTDNESVFLITFSGETIERIIQEPEPYSTSFLHFGTNEQIRTSNFLKTPTGVESSETKGYVMTRQGSIVGISTNLESLRGEGKIQIVIYRNGEEINFGNRIDVSSEGSKKDYDIQSNGIVTFNQGDIISAYIQNNQGVALTDVTTLIEVSNRI